MLAALERAVGAVVGVNAVPRAKIGAVLHALDAHPRVWIGKKQRIEVRATAERPQLLLSMRDDGSLVVGTAVPCRPSNARDARGLASLPWTLDGAMLVESAALPANFPASGTLIIPRDEIPDFLSRRMLELGAHLRPRLRPGLRGISARGWDGLRSRRGWTGASPA